MLDDLRRRLDGYRGIERGIVSDWSHGVPTEFLDRLVDHWRTSYDWCAEEARLNAWNHYRTDIDGTTVHFVHEQGKGPDPLPIVLTHGWPWTFADYRALVGPLTDPAAYGGDPADAFDVVLPSLPGFGFSNPARPDLNFWKAADLWVRLMVDRLGYGRFARARLRHGGDAHRATRARARGTTGRHPYRDRDPADGVLGRAAVGRPHGWRAPGTRRFGTRRALAQERRYRRAHRGPVPLTDDSPLRCGRRSGTFGARDACSSAARRWGRAADGGQVSPATRPHAWISIHPPSSIARGSRARAEPHLFSLSTAQAGSQSCTALPSGSTRLANRPLGYDSWSTSTAMPT